MKCYVCKKDAVCYNLWLDKYVCIKCDKKFSQLHINRMFFSLADICYLGEATFFYYKNDLFLLKECKYSLNLKKMGSWLVGI